jgi:hypothetical protein
MTDEHRSDIGSPDAASGINVRAMESHGPFGQMIFFFCGYGGGGIAQLSRRGPGRRGSAPGSAAEGSVVGYEHDHAAVGEVRDVGGGRLALG